MTTADYVCSNALQDENETHERMFLYDENETHQATTLRHERMFLRAAAAKADGLAKLARPIF